MSHHHHYQNVTRPSYMRIAIIRIAIMRIAIMTIVNIAIVIVITIIISTINCLVYRAVIETYIRFISQTQVYSRQNNPRHLTDLC